MANSASTKARAKGAKGAKSAKGGGKKTYQSPRQLGRQSTILACARQLLEERGYAGMNMRELAVRAGVSKATLYNLFESKDKLAVAAVDDLMGQSGQRVAEQQAAEGIDAILSATQVSGEKMHDSPNYTDAMARALLTAKADDPLVEALFERGHPFVMQQLLIAQDKGQIAAEVNAELLAHHIAGQGWGITLLWMMGKISWDEMVRESLRSQIMTLLGVATGKTKRDLQSRLDDLGWQRPSA